MQAFVSIGNESNRKIVFCCKFFMRRFAVARDADNLYAEIFKIFLKPTKIGSLEGTARSIVFRVKVEKRVCMFI